MTEEANVVALRPDRFGGYDTTWEHMKYWGARGALRGGIWGLLLGGGFFLIPGVSPALTAGPLLGALVTGLGLAAMVGGLSALAARLIHFGFRKKMRSSAK